MFKYLQNMGKSLMLPVSVLPAAAILMGIGYWIDPGAWGGESAVAAVLITAGSALIDNMAILFAIGIGFGMSKDKNGAAALAGLVAFLVFTSLLSPGAVSNILGRELSEVHFLAFSRIQNQFVGIMSGCIAAALYNKFHKTELPQFLAFFSGRRLVPIITSGVMTALAFIFMFIWPAIFAALVTFGEWMSGLGAFGAALYGFFNRLLLPIGLHHTLNSVFWFDLVGINDLGNFWGAGGGEVGVTGMYMAGWFPIMMFGLVGAAAAFIRTAKPENRSRVMGIMTAAGFTTFFTGVTEPVEFAFMFAAPVLFVIHALLTATSMFIAASMQWFAGFGFSAGLVDLILSIPIRYATQWYMLIPLGIAYFFIYYFVFTFVIKKFNLKTLGREDEDLSDDTAAVESGNWVELAKIYLDALGGSDNIVELDNCITRLRLVVKNTELIQENKLKQQGASGVIKSTKTEAQIVVGPQVQFVADAIKSLI